MLHDYPGGVLHHHHHQLINHRIEHDHDPDEHDEVFRHADHTFGDYDLLFGPSCVDHHLSGSVEKHHGDAPTVSPPSLNPYDHPTDHHDIDDAFNDDDD